MEYIVFLRIALGNYGTSGDPSGEWEKALLLCIRINLGIMQRYYYSLQN
jgi:hypothetical protein